MTVNPEHAVLLGLIQGISEFLPISSSGHLVVVQSLIKEFHSPGLVFDLVLHAGTLMAVIAYYWKDLLWLIKGAVGCLPGKEIEEARKLIWMLIIGTIPAAVFGVIAEDALAKLFENPRSTSVFLCGTGLILLCGEWLHKRMEDREDPSSEKPIKNAFLVGLAQALALFPGVSRSGSTMAAGLAVGWNRQRAARFSFLLMIPVVAGAVILKIPDLPVMLRTGSVNGNELVIGFATAAISGYLSIAVLLKLIRRYSFKIFGVYCMAVGIISLIFFTVSG